MRPIVIHHRPSLTLGGTELMVQLLLKYIMTLDKTFNHILAFNAHEDRTREPYFADILGTERLVPYASWPEFTEVLKQLKPFIVHHYSAGIPEYPCLPMNYGHSKHWIQTSVFGNQNDTIEFSKIIYVAKHVQHLAGTFGPKYHVVRNPIELPETDLSLRQELGIDDDVFVFGRIGRDDPQIYDAINLEAYARVQSDKTAFIIIGASDQTKADIERLGLKNVYLIDKTIDRKRLSMFYNTMNVLAHARKDGECCPANIFEAMAHGKPIISHYGMPFNGQVDSIGDAGFVVAPGDVDEYAKIMKAFISRDIDYRALAYNAVKQWERETEPHQQAAKQLAIYKELE